MNLVASPNYIEHDSFMIFQHIMENTKAWFESNQRQGETEVKKTLDEGGLRKAGAREPVRPFLAFHSFSTITTTISK